MCVHMLYAGASTCAVLRARDHVLVFTALLLIIGDSAIFLGGPRSERIVIIPSPPGSYPWSFIAHSVQYSPPRLVDIQWVLLGVGPYPVTTKKIENMGVPSTRILENMLKSKATV